LTDRSRWFVSTDWLLDHLGDPDVVVVDGSWHLSGTGREGRAEYDMAHIPGAVFFDIDAIADRSNPLPHMLPDAATFAAAVGALGIDDKQTIVVYDSMGLSSAPRVWWTFRIMGAADVAILDGGLPRWTGEKRPVDDKPVNRSPRQFAARLDADAVHDLARVAAGVVEGSLQLVDARPAARFRGEAPEPRPWVRTGRIPGSLNLPSGELIDDGRLKDAAALRQAFIDAGVDLDRPITTSCGSGVNAAILSLALDIIGVKGTALYDGSWTDWGTRDGMPVAIGTNPAPPRSP
jgi:thiosulfate/3-mercaptopyruvate sulfurtransferase